MLQSLAREFALNGVHMFHVEHPELGPASIRACLLQRQANLEAGPARHALDEQVAPMHPNDALCRIEPQTKAMARRLGGEERFEDAHLLVLGNTGAVVLYLDQH